MACRGDYRSRFTSESGFYAFAHIHNCTCAHTFTAGMRRGMRQPFIKDALQLSAITGPYLYLFNPNLHGV